jgi:uncharacterized membrane protein
MSELIAIIYPSEQQAEEVRQRLLKLQNEYLIQMEDAVIAVKTGDGRVQLRQMISPTAIGAAMGSFWGLLIGVLLLPALGPAGGLVGIAAGAATGALSGALTDLGIDDAFMKEMATDLQPGNAVLFVLARKITLDKVLDYLRGTGGKILQTSLDRSKEAALRQAVEDVRDQEMVAEDKEELLVAR